MVKTFKFLIISLLFFSNSIAEIQKSSFNGKWTYELTSNENELLNKSFELNLIQNNNKISGQYCAISKGGRKIDCIDEKINNINGIIKDNIAYVTFFGFYDNKSTGKAKLYFDNNQNLVWEILEVNGENYAPKKIILMKIMKKENNLEGDYVLISCEDSRFKIKISKKDAIYFYTIFDKSKTISKGVIKINKNNIFNLNKIEGEIFNDRIIIKNYNNTKRQDKHFTQCQEQYLTFIKNNN